MAAAQYDRPWRRITADLRAKLETGRWQPGDRLPTTEQLATQYDPSFVCRSRDSSAPRGSWINGPSRSTSTTTTS
ncbi:MAG: GntR family transcriptional regulator [Pseudonocardia sp.]|nr:GntR family transcriptional regulator [Pseudonocardia sp.]